MSDRESLNITASITDAGLEAYAKDNRISVLQASTLIKDTFFDIDKSALPYDAYNNYDTTGYLNAHVMSSSNPEIIVDGSDVVAKMHAFVTTFGNYLFDFTADWRDNDDYEIFGRYSMLRTGKGPKLAYSPGMLTEVYPATTILDEENLGLTVDDDE